MHTIQHNLLLMVRDELKITKHTKTLTQNQTINTTVLPIQALPS